MRVVALGEPTDRFEVFVQAEDAAVPVRARTGQGLAWALALCLGLISQLPCARGEYFFNEVRKFGFSHELHGRNPYAALVEGSEFPHGPVADGDCVACHDPHASPNFRVLKERYPRRYYAPFSFRSYGLCFTCHDKPFILNEETDWLTGFRDGHRNLHFLHVNRKEKGRKCTNCHDIHASIKPKHIRETSVFGTWEMELLFEKTETGGSCDPGCHEQRSYDRDNRVNKDWKPTDWDE